jgi:hypothetical protein
MKLAVPHRAVLLTRGQEGSVLCSRKKDEVETLEDVSSAAAWLRSLATDNFFVGIPASDGNVSLIHRFFEDDLWPREQFLLGPGGYRYNDGVMIDHSRLWAGLEAVTSSRPTSLWRYASQEDAEVYRLAHEFLRGRDHWFGVAPELIPLHPAWPAVSFFEPSTVYEVGFVLSRLREPDPTRGTVSPGSNAELFRQFDLHRAAEFLGRPPGVTRNSSISAAIEAVWRSTSKDKPASFIERQARCASGRSLDYEQRLVASRRCLLFLVDFWKGLRHPECFDPLLYFDAESSVAFRSHVARIQTASSSRLTP